MRILLVSGSYSPVLGGVQTVTNALAKGLLEDGHAVQVVTNRYPLSLPGREMLHRVPVSRWLTGSPVLSDVRRGRIDLFAAMLCFYPVTLLRYETMFRRFRPDVINVHFPDAQIPFVLRLRRRYHFRLVVSLHGHDIWRYFPAPDGPGPGNVPMVYAKPLQRLLREADAVTACSWYLLEKAIALEPSVEDKGTAIYNGIEPERFRDTRSYPHDRPYVLALGRLTYAKGFDMLLEAFAQICREDRSFDLLIAGDGEEEEALQSQANSLGLHGRVRFLGRASPSDVVALLNGCTLVVAPSRKEPFGIVALEALAAGKPVVATRVEGLAEFLGHVITQANSAAVPSNRGASGTKCALSGSGIISSGILLVDPTPEGVADGIRRQLRHCATAEPDARVRDAILAEYAWREVTRRYERVLLPCSE